MPETSPNRLAIVCGACGYPSSAYVAGKIDYTGDENQDPFELSLVQCEFCAVPSLVRQDEAGEAFPVEVWPTSRQALDAAIPQQLRDGVNEARKCFDASAFLATAVMVRRTIEGFCAERGARGRDLNRALRDLVERDVIDPRLLEWADNLRIFGNVGAHFSDESVNRQDASDALDLIEAILNYVYLFSGKFEQFKERRGKSETPHN